MDRHDGKAARDAVACFVCEIVCSDETGIWIVEKFTGNDQVRIPKSSIGPVGEFGHEVVSDLLAVVLKNTCEYSIGIANHQCVIMHDRVAIVRGEDGRGF